MTIFDIIEMMVVMVIVMMMMVMLVMRMMMVMVVMRMMMMVMRTTFVASTGSVEAQLTLLHTGAIQLVSAWQVNYH